MESKYLPSFFVQGNCRAYALRFFLLVLLPFLLGAFILPHEQHVMGQELGIQNNIMSEDGVETYLFVQSDENDLVAKRLNSVFPLAGYFDISPFVARGGTVICFQDNGSHVLLPDNTTVLSDFEWSILFDNRTTVGVKPNSAKCLSIVLGQEYSYSWSLSPISVDPGISGVATFVPKTSTFTRITVDYGVLQGLVMIPVAFLLIWYPYAGIKKKIFEGMDAQ